MNIFESIGRSMVSETVEYDEFKIQIDDGWVHILDGEEAVRVSMPKDVFDGLVKKYVS